MKPDLSRLHWPQVVLLCVLWVSALSGLVVLAVTDSLAKVPAPVWGLLGTLLAGGTGASFMGSAVKPAERDSTPPTTPAAEAKRRHTATQRGEAAPDRDPTPRNHEP